MNCICRPSRIMSVRINLLDETDFIHEIKDDLPGQALLDVVFGRLNLIETSYFGIRYVDEENQTHWLDPASRISRQLKPKSDPFDLYFGVKFYTADPCKLLEEITRYQLFLQVKQDVLQARLPVSFELAAELGAFVVQSELGDYDARRHSKGYVSEFRLLPNQSSELETRVAELHQQLKGMSPATAELNYLDKVKWHEMYGVDLHPVLGEDSVEYFLGLTPSGVVVLRNKTTVAHYYWPRIAKVYYKGRYFMLRISDKNNELSTYGFETPRKSACKHLWRCCVEHHAFFRLVRMAPLPNSQSATSDLFQLGSRLRYSGRSEKQAAKDALSVGRTPPVFIRLPSKRQPRRLIDDFLNGSKTAESYISGNIASKTTVTGKSSTAPRQTNIESPYRSTYSIPTSLGIRPYHQQQQHANSFYNGGSSNLQTPDSPRSTRSAPWPRSQQRSLFGNNPSSPRSVRSASTTGARALKQYPKQHQKSRSHASGGGDRGTSSANQQRYRSSSVESQSSNDSRSTRRHRHRHRRTSDNESELSRGSGRSGRSHHRKYRRSRHHRDSGGSGRDSSRGRSYSGHRASSGHSGSTELIDSTSQWREAQRRQAEASLGLSSVQKASVSKSSMVARSLHSNDSHSETHSHHKSRRHRKNKSPPDSRNRIWSNELAKHLQFGLVDTTGMSEDQLREIPYTVVETTSKRSTSNLKIHKSSSKSSVGGKSNGSGNTITNGSGGGHSVTSGGQKNRVDRIRGLYFQNSNPNPNENNVAKNGSIRSASTISSRECDRNNGLVRMMSSMSMGDFISPTGSNLSPQENSALRVSHEHTDSGLGADQDYAYSSERSSDSTRYGTNKSSGASSGSHRKSACGSHSGAVYNNIIQHPTVSNQQKRQNSFYAHRQLQQQQQQQLHCNGPFPKCSSVPPSANFKYPSNPYQSSSLAPIHNPSNQGTSPHSTNYDNSGNSEAAGNGNNSPCETVSIYTSPTINPSASASASFCASASLKTGNNNVSNNNRLVNYTTFENNQYKFNLNNAMGCKNGAPNGGGACGSSGGGGGGGGCITNLNMDRFLQMAPSSPAAPYYYNGAPTSYVEVKKRDAKSDIGVPTPRFSGIKALTKMHLLTGQFASSTSANYDPLISSTWYGGGGDNCLATRLQPAKSDLFLSYMNTSASVDYDRPHIYNYQMPQMPEFMSQHPSELHKQQQPTNSQQQKNIAAYHISGAQTADLPPALYKPTSSSSRNSVLYAGTAPANDVLYYQFDNGSAPIVKQPTKSSVVGPLVFIPHSDSGGTNATVTTNDSNTSSTEMQQTSALSSSTITTHHNHQQQQQQLHSTDNTINDVNSDDNDDDDDEHGDKKENFDNNENVVKVIDNENISVNKTLAVKKNFQDHGFHSDSKRREDDSNYGSKADDNEDYDKSTTDLKDNAEAATYFDETEENPTFIRYGTLQSRLHPNSNNCNSSINKSTKSLGANQSERYTKTKEKTSSIPSVIQDQFAHRNNYRNNNYNDNPYNNNNNKKIENDCNEWHLNASINDTVIHHSNTVNSNTKNNQENALENENPNENISNRMPLQNETGIENRISNISVHQYHHHNHNQHHNQHNQQNHNHNNHNQNSRITNTSGVSSSLEIILTPIIQSSRRAH